jgi:protoporphyrinogen oxidase
VRSDLQDGFILDRGFQVLLSSYHSTHELLQGSGISFHHFLNGAFVFKDRGFHAMFDPLREPWRAIATATSAVGTFADRFRMLQFRRRALRGNQPPLHSALAELQQLDFSEGMIEEFFRPFFGGIFLEPALATSATALYSRMQSFSSGTALLPAGGMGEIPKGMARKLNSQQLLLNQTVTAVEKDRVRLASGEEIQAKAVVVAIDAAALGTLLPAMRPPPTIGVYTLYFDCPAAARPEPVLYLNGSRQGVINNLTVPSAVAPQYAPNGRALLSVTVLDQPGLLADELPTSVQKELSLWFGAQATNYRLLRCSKTEHALPEQRDASRWQEQKPWTSDGGCIVAGDFTQAASIEGAVRSGQAAADMVQQLLETRE